MDKENEEFIQAKGLPERDVEIFEVSVEDTLKEIYHSWLGETEDQEGNYRRNTMMTRLMNEKGASFIIGEMKARINTNMHFSDLDEAQITWMSSKTAENIMDRLMYYYPEYEIEVKDIESICDQVLDALETLLSNARDGGMKQYKVARSKVIIQKNQQSSEVQPY